MSLVGLQATAVKVAYTPLAATYRFTWLEGVEEFEPVREARPPVIICFWHSRIIGATRYIHTRLHKRGLPAHVIVSRSKDGELITRWLNGIGVTTSRGSSSRGGSAALRDLVRVARRRAHAVVTTPDGPRGPERRVQPGTILIAQLSGLPIYPLSYAAERAWRLRSWDRFIVPKFFSRLAVVVGDPIHVPRDATDEDREAARLALERAMHRADERAAELAGVGV